MLLALVIMLFSIRGPLSLDMAICIGVYSSLIYCQIDYKITQFVLNSNIFSSYFLLSIHHNYVFWINTTKGYKKASQSYIPNNVTLQVLICYFLLKFTYILLVYIICQPIE